MVAPREISDFLRTRRDRLTPAEVGFSPGGARRRVAGLRREEVALLAGISVEYYVQVERGNVRGVSEDVLAAIARALRLDDVERDHLFDLTRAVKQTAAPRRSTATEVRVPVWRVLETITDAVAFIRNGRADFVAGNALARALYADVVGTSTRPVSLPRFVFLDPRARTFYRKWSGIAEATAGSLRAEAARDPYDRDLTDLIGELSTRSDDFRRMWATNDVTAYRSGTQYFRHPIVGDLDLDYETFDLTTDIGQSLVVYCAPAGSESQNALRRLVEE